MHNRVGVPAVSIAYRRVSCVWSAILVGLAVAGGPRAAWATEQPVLVVVEAPPGLGLDAVQIRRAIETELHQPAVAPTRALEDDPSRALIVAVDRERVTMSLRESHASAVTRAISCPADPAGRLRVIAWLAGNLARDQVAGLVASPPEPPEPSRSPETSPPPSLPAGDPPAAPAPATTPPPFTAPAAVVMSHAEPNETSPPAWTIGVAAGPAFSTYTTGRALHSITGAGNFTNRAPDIYRGRGTLWRIEARHSAAASRMFTGLDVEGTGGVDPRGIDEVFAARAIVGWVRRWRGWSLDYNLGAGLDLTEQPQASYTIGNTGVAETYQSVLRPGLFASAGVTAAHPLGDVLDAVLSFDVHQSLIDGYDGFYSLTLGLRYRL